MTNDELKLKAVYDDGFKKGYEKAEKVVVEDCIEIIYKSVHPATAWSISQKLKKEFGLEMDKK